MIQVSEDDPKISEYFWTIWEDEQIFPIAGLLKMNRIFPEIHELLIFYKIKD